LIKAYFICSNAPISFKLVVGILANPYLFNTGTTSLLAIKKSSTINYFSDSIFATILFTHLFKAYCKKLIKSTAT